MKTKNLVIYCFSLAILYGVYLGIGAAVVLNYIVITISFIGYLLAIWAVGKMDEDTLVELRKAITPITTILGALSTALFAYVYYITANYNLLFLYGILVSLMWTFIYKLFNTTSEE